MKIKKIFLAIVLSAVFIVPTVSLANDYVGARKGFGMMQQIESKVMGTQTHEEMENLMEKMMSGNLTDTETAKITEMVGKYPGAMGMMTNRFMADNMMNNSSQRYGHMGMMGDWGTGWGSFWYWIMFLGVLAWVVVGILLVIWLIKQISKK